MDGWAPPVECGTSPVLGLRRSAPSAEIAGRQDSDAAGCWIALSQVDEAAQDPADKEIADLAGADVRRYEGDIDPGLRDVEGHCASQGSGIERQAGDVPGFRELRRASNPDVVEDPVSPALDDDPFGQEALAGTDPAIA